MHKTVRNWLIAAFCLVLFGGIVFTGAMVALGMDFAGLSTVEYETKTHEVQGDFWDIQIAVREADVQLVWAEDGLCRVVCKDREKVNYAVSVTDGMLSVAVQDDRAWYDYIGIFLGQPTVTVYLPRSNYETCWLSTVTGDVSIPKNLSFRELQLGGITGEAECLGRADNLIVQWGSGDVLIDDCDPRELQVITTTGDVEVRESEIGSVRIKTTTGDVELERITATNCYTECDTGEVFMENVTAVGDLQVITTTGDVELEGCDAGNVEVKTTTGDVSASLLSGKLFTAKSDTGRIRIPDSQPGDECQITTDTGDIYVTVE